MRLPLAALAALVLAVPAAAQTTADSAAVRASALDYAEGWYEGSAERMSRAQLAKVDGRWVIVNVLWERKPGHGA